MNGGWKLFYSDADPSMFAQASVVNLISPQLSVCCVRLDCFGIVGLYVKLKVEDRLLCLCRCMTPNGVSEYQAFVNDVNDALQRVGSTESLNLLEDFNVHIGADNEAWKSVIGWHENQRLTRTAGNSRSFVVVTGLFIMTTFSNSEMSTSTYGTDLVRRRSL